MAIKAQTLADFTYPKEDETLDPNDELAKKGEVKKNDGDTIR